MAYMMNPEYVLFQHGERKKGTEGEFYCEKIGDLTLTSGEIVVCDPLMDFYEEPLAKKVAPGTYPVFLTINRFENEDERVAYATLQFNTSNVVRWEMALKDGQDVKDLEDDFFYGYGVDTGTSCFVDKEAKEFLLAYQDEKDTLLYDMVEEELQKIISIQEIG